MELKVYCNGIQYPYTLEDHGNYFDIYQNTDMYFISIDSTFNAVTDQLNRLALVWPTKPIIDCEIDDIEIDFLYIGKNKLLNESSFYHTTTTDLVDPPRHFDLNYWKSGTQINNPGVFYLPFNLPIEKWCF